MLLQRISSGCYAHLPIEMLQKTCENFLSDIIQAMRLKYARQITTPRISNYIGVLRFTMRECG